MIELARIDLHIIIYVNCIYDEKPYEIKLDTKYDDQLYFIID